MDSPFVEGPHSTEVVAASAVIFGAGEYSNVDRLSAVRRALFEFCQERARGGPASSTASDEAAPLREVPPPPPGAYFDVVFDGPPSHESGRFVEVEDEKKASVRAGEWIEDPPFWRLRIRRPSLPDLAEDDFAKALAEGGFPATFSYRCAARIGYEIARRRLAE